MKTIQNGILLRKYNYSETSLIVHFFTKEIGTQSFIFQGGKRKNKKGNLLQPLSLVEITSYHRNDSDLGKIVEINVGFIFKSVPFDPIKSGIAFFVAEILSSVLKSNDADEALYDFLIHEIKWLDFSAEYTNYLIWFLLKLTDYLGIGIHVEEKNGAIFDMQEGSISNRTPNGVFTIDNAMVGLLKLLLQKTKSELLVYQISKQERRELISILLKYYQLHIPAFKTPKSLQVMQTIME